MSKIKYVLKRIFNMSIKNMFDVINKTAKKSKKNKLFIFFDMIYCGLKYQAGYMDYYLFEFYNLNRKERKTQMTRGINDKYIKYFNNKEYNHYFSNKDEFNKKFKKFLKREYIILDNNEDKFNTFVEDKEYIICKPRSGSCGKGIEKIKVSSYKNKNLYKYLLKNNLIVVEEVIKQNIKMNKMNSASVNTIRIVSILNDNKVYTPVAFLRIGTNGKFVDNFNSGGMVAPLDMATGKITFKAISKSGNVFERHPDTNTKLVDFQVPFWDDVISLVKKAAFVVPEVGMVGWDVAISNDGPLLIEGNEYPGHDIYQLPVHRNDGTGLLPIFEKIKKF